MSRPTKRLGLGPGGMEELAGSSTPPQPMQPSRQDDSAALSGYIAPHLRTYTHASKVQVPSAKATDYVPPHLRTSIKAPRAFAHAPVVQVPESKAADRVLPHLRTSVQGTEVQNSYQEAAAYVPPHLRSSNLQGKDSIKLTQLRKPSLQVKSVPTLEVEEDKIGQHSAPIHAPKAPFVQTKELAARQSQFNENYFVDMLIKQKAEADAKRKAAAEERLQPGYLPPPPKPVRSTFRPTAGTDQAMQDFLVKGITGPATNGKKYIYTGGQKSPEPIDGDLHPSATPATKPLEVVMRSDEPGGSKVSADALVEVGYEPRPSSEGFGSQISDAGVEVVMKENIRATQGEDAQKALKDWNGMMLPPPVDWETERGSFDNSFMRGYIAGDWEPQVLREAMATAVTKAKEESQVPRGSMVAIETTAKEFQGGEHPVGFDTPFITPLQQEPTTTDYAKSENQQKQRAQTAEGAAKLFIKKLQKKSQQILSAAEAQEANALALAFKAPEPHPYAPTIEVYLRPAIESDAEGIAGIYNHYVTVQHSIGTEDQAAVTKEDITYLISHVRNERLPFIVAIKGRKPLPSSVHAPLKGQPALPQYEAVVGFGYAECYSYGFGGYGFGRTRFTRSIAFYVHPEYTGKKVGRSLLDRLIQCLSHSYGSKDGYDWLNPKDDPVYHAGGVQKCHQIVIQYASHSPNDESYKRMKEFLGRYYFDEGGRLCRVLRSSTKGPDKARFADLVFFLKEASPPAEFSPIV